MIDIKESLKYSFKELPKTFRIEDRQYIDAIWQASSGFVVLAVITLCFVFLYLFLRFFSKKCIGPVKVSHITRSYRNLTWIMLSILKLIQQLHFY